MKKNYVVVVKAIDLPAKLETDELYSDYVDIDELVKEELEGGKQTFFNEYTIDPNSRTLHVINGKLCVVYIAIIKRQPND